MGGTHPTGRLSCLKTVSFKSAWNVIQIKINDIPEQANNYYKGTVYCGFEGKENTTIDPV